MGIFWPGLEGAWRPWAYHSSMLAAASRTASVVSGARGASASGWVARLTASSKRRAAAQAATTSRSGSEGRRLVQGNTCKKEHFMIYSCMLPTKLQFRRREQ